ncbi:hypothetical protein B296_00033830, partial [Ensete ventricosum]
GAQFHFILAFAIDYTTCASPTDGQFNVFLDNTNLSPSAISSIKQSNGSIIQDYNLDGIDIDYEHFQADAYTFAECIGQLLMILKNNGLISFASIAPFDDAQVQSHYQAVWSRYSNVNRPCQLPVLRVRFEHSGVAVLELLPDS